MRPRVNGYPRQRRKRATPPSHLTATISSLYRISHSAASVQWQRLGSRRFSHSVEDTQLRWAQQQQVAHQEVGVGEITIGLILPPDHVVRTFVRGVLDRLQTLSKKTQI